MVHLDPDQITGMVDTYAPAPSDQSPAVVDGMREHLPAGPYLTGDALDAAFAEQRWGAAAFLDPAAGALVLVAVGT